LLPRAPAAQPLAERTLVVPGVGDARQLSRCRHGQRGRRDIVCDARRSQPVRFRRVLGPAGCPWSLVGPDEEDGTFLVIGPFRVRVPAPALLVEAANATKRLAGKAGQHGTKALSKRPARHDGDTGAILDTAAGRRAHRRTDRRTRRHVTRTATEVLGEVADRGLIRLTRRQVTVRSTRPLPSHSPASETAHQTRL